MGRRTNPVTFHGTAALLLALALTAGLLLLFRLPPTWPYLLAGWLVAVNVTTLGYYGHDKARARGGGRRVPEVVLHGLVVLGGTLGAYLGMRLFRHKTVKGRFRIVFWCIVFLQVMLVAAVASRVVRDRREGRVQAG